MEVNIKEGHNTKTVWKVYLTRKLNIKEKQHIFTVCEQMTKHICNTVLLKKAVVSERAVALQVKVFLHGPCGLEKPQ